MGGEPASTTLLERRSRYRGALLGLATGDALGTTLEFCLPGTFTPIEDIVGGGPFDLKPGQWTDDTSMALCLADSLIARREFNARDQAQQYIRWMRHGHLSSTGECFDIGVTIRRALLRFESSGNALSGLTDEFSAGNGSIMRLAPVPLAFAANPAKAIELSAESSRTTHGVDVAVDACRYFGGLIVGAVAGVDKETLLSDRWSPVDGCWDERPLAPPIDEIAAGSFKHRQPPEIVGSGYVAKSLEAALWAFYHSESFKDGCLKAVNLGNDADTTGAVYGQLAGAFYGEEAIPADWRDKLAYRDLIEEFADGLVELSHSSP